MLYPKYFKTGQKVQLRAIQPPPPEGRNELLSAVLEAGGSNYFDLLLPYGPDAAHQYPFREEMPFELSTDSMGLGAKVTVTFKETLSGNTIRVLVMPDLQMFQRRAQPRIDCTIGIRFTRTQKSLQTLRQTWEKNASILTNAKTPPALQGFNLCQLNLSPGGIRFQLQPPAEPADICLMLLDLGDDKAPICALTEIIWVTGKNENNTLNAGMQFIDILEQDQQRISRFISDHS